MTELPYASQGVVQLGVGGGLVRRGGDSVDGEAAGRNPAASCTASSALLRDGKNGGVSGLVRRRTQVFDKLSIRKSVSQDDDKWALRVSQSLGKKCVNYVPRHYWQ